MSQINEKGFFETIKLSEQYTIFDNSCSKYPVECPVSAQYAYVIRV